MHKAPASQPYLGSLLVFELTDEQCAYFRPEFQLFEVAFVDDILELWANASEPLEFAPQSVLWAVTASLTDDKRRLIESGLANLSLDVPIVDFFNGMKKPFVAFASQIARSSRLAAEAHLNLAELRRAHEQLQNSYSGLRDFFDEGGYIVPKLSFYNPPADNFETTERKIRTIRQRLPVEFRIICGVGLYIREATPSSRGVLCLTVACPDDDNIQPISWTVAYADFQDGWNTFAFEQTEYATQKSAFIQLTFDRYGGPAPTFIFGSPQLRSDRAAVIDDILHSRSLALKVWSTLPGARMNVTAKMRPAFLSGTTPIIRLSLPIEPELEVIDLFELNHMAGFAVVLRDTDMRRILVHPVGSEPTVAKLPLVCPPGTWSVTAEINTDNNLAGPVEYGLAVVPEGQIFDRAALADQLAINWVLLEAGLRTKITHVLDTPLQHELSLLLLTRVRPGGSTDYAWCHFQDILIHVG